MNMLYGLLTGDVFIWVTNVHKSPKQRNPQLETQKYEGRVGLVFTARYAVTIEGDRFRDVGSPH